MPSWSLFQAGSSPAWILVCAAFQSMVKGFLGGSPAFLQQIQVHECQFKFLPIRHPVFCYGPISLWHLFICLLKKTQNQRVPRNVPLSSCDFPGFRNPTSVLCEEGRIQCSDRCYLFSPHEGGGDFGVVL